MVCRILVFRWSLGALEAHVPKIGNGCKPRVVNFEGRECKALWWQLLRATGNADNTNSACSPTQGSRHHQDWRKLFRFVISSFIKTADTLSSGKGCIPAEPCLGVGVKTTTSSLRTDPLSALAHDTGQEQVHCQHMGSSPFRNLNFQNDGPYHRHKWSHLAPLRQRRKPCCQLGVSDNQGPQCRP